MRSEFVSFMTSQQRLDALAKIKSGKADQLPDWVKEGLQDLGWIDHRDQLTKAGEDWMVARSK